MIYNHPADSKGSVLITGGSGFVGRHLSSILLEKGYSVSHLSRKANLFGKIEYFAGTQNKIFWIIR